jgi:hypothetical protein
MKTRVAVMITILISIVWIEAGFLLRGTNIDPASVVIVCIFGCIATGIVAYAVGGEW